MDPTEAHGKDFLLPVPIAGIIAQHNDYTQQVKLAGRARTILDFSQITLADVFEFFDDIIVGGRKGNQQ